MTGTRHSETTWDAAKADYLAGMTAEQICRRYGIGLRTFREHAADGEWRRADADDPPSPAEDDLTIFADLQIEDVEKEALMRTAAAVMRGQPMDAQRWQRVYEFWHDSRLNYDRICEADRRALERQRAAAAKEAAQQATEEAPQQVAQPASPSTPAPAARAVSPPAPHSPHPNFNRAVPGPPLNRAERRRLARLQSTPPPP